MLIFSLFEVRARVHNATFKFLKSISKRGFNTLTNIPLKKGTVPKRLDLCYHFGTFYNISSFISLLKYRVPRSIQVFNFLHVIILLLRLKNFCYAGQRSHRCRNTPRAYRSPTPFSWRCPRTGCFFGLLYV